MANALQTQTGALGYVTELLSGDFATPFGRSSHHQIWSEAMIVTPTLRGLLGIEALDGGRTLRFAPALPATWDRVEAKGVRVGAAQYDLAFERSGDRAVVRVGAREAATPRLILAPAYPLDARVRRVTINGAVAKHESTEVGDVQRVEVTVAAAGPATEVVFSGEQGTDVYAEPQPIRTGADNEGLRLLRVRADARALHLLVEGRAGRAYTIVVRSPHGLGAADGVTSLEPSGGYQRREIHFTGPEQGYVRRDIAIPFVR